MSRRNFLGGLAGLAAVALSPLRALGVTSPIRAVLKGTPGASVATVSVSASKALTFYVEYGATTKYGLRTKTVALASGKSTDVVLAGLTPKSKVFYRLRYQLTGSKTLAFGPTGALTTTALATTSSLFTVQADPHMDENSSADVYSKSLKLIAGLSPAFLMDLGDIFMVDKLPQKSETNIRGRFELMKGFYKLLGDVPLKITLGNHDGELGYSTFNTKNYRREYFPEQTGELAYFSFTGPDQLHIVLDPFTYTTANPKADGWQWTLGKVQYDWFKQTLAQSQERHKFVYIHHLLVGDATSRGGVEIAGYNEWGGKNMDGSYGFDKERSGWGKPIHQLLLDHGVGIVFKGHDHLYMKQDLDGIIYQTLPQPSHPVGKTDPNQYGYKQGKWVAGSGFLKVFTEGNTATVEFIRYDGSTGDSYTRSV